MDLDYCLIPIDKQHLFEDFKVLPILEASTNFHIPVDCSLPDHSILLWSTKLDCTLISNPNIAPHKAKLIIPPGYMESEHAANKVRALSNHLHPHAVNRSYTDICDCILSELGPSSSLKVRKCSHPWWNPTLNQLKHDLRYCQRAWLKQKNNPQLKLSYQTLQKAFDKAVKKAKSEYRKHRQIHLLHQYKNDSKNFWRNFKQIGIDSERKSIPKQVINTEGEDCHGYCGSSTRSRSGKKYTLVVCDYATRYPEAIPLHSVDAEHVAEELVKLFARVGVPTEILTDQGTNFVSQLLAEVYLLLP